MQKIQPSSAESPNPDFIERKRRSGEDNAAWLAAAVKREKVTRVVLVGGTDNLALRLRIAQAHARDTMTPGHFSHAFLLFGWGSGGPAGAPIYEIALDPPGGFGFPGATNGLQEGTLKRYADPETYPNIALIELPIDARECASVLRKFGRQRAVLDASDLIVRWLAFAWGVGSHGNPLLEGHGVPGAAMIEAVCNAAGFDITPNVPSRSSSPEAIWQAAKWWHEFPRAEAGNLSGMWYVSDRIGDQSDENWERRLDEVTG